MLVFKRPPNHWFHYWAALFFFLFAFLVVFSNHNDWDQFLSTMEVDLRSWLIDKRPPFWSYQLCAGSTRAGDPQAFGLSPLILIPIMLGSFWGLKVLTLLLTLLGYFGLTRLLGLTAPAENAPSEQTKLVHTSLAFFLLFGNYYLGRVHGGQLTFLLLPFTFFFLQLFLRGLKERLRVTSTLLLFLAVFTYCTSGFYHSLVFFLLPSAALFSLALFVHALRAGFKLPTGFSKRAMMVAVPTLLALGLSSYKWLAVLRYQAAHPRILEAVRETNSLFHLLIYFFVPTFNLRFGGIWEFFDRWGAAEYSAFCFLPFALIATLVWLVRKEKAAAWKQLWLPEFLVCGLLTILLCLGDSSPLPIHGMLNSLLYNNSVRVVGRYHVLLLFLMALFLARLASVHKPFRQFYIRHLLPAGVLVSGISMLSFFPLLGMEKFAYTAFSPQTAEREMRKLVIVPPRLIMARGDSFMYNSIKQSNIALNCYQPLARETRVAVEQGFVNEMVTTNERELDLLSAGRQPLSEECRRSAYVTQNEVFFDERACPADLCFKLNMLNPYEPAKLIFNEERKLFCVR